MNCARASDILFALALMNTHQPFNGRMIAGQSCDIDALTSLFVRGLATSPTLSIVQTPHLDIGDAIQLIRVSDSSPPSWQTPASHIVSLTAVSSPVILNLIPKVGDTRTIQLSRFQTAIIWPGAAYRINSPISDGLVLRMQRDLKLANAISDQGPPPASGYFLPPSTRDVGTDDISNLLPPHEVPGLELKLVEGFTENEAHYHRTFGEVYIVASGSIVTRLTCPTSRQSKTQELNAGDAVVIPANTIHHVVGGSQDNRILVAYWPRFRGTLGDDWHRP